MDAEANGPLKVVDHKSIGRFKKSLEARLRGLAQTHGKLMSTPPNYGNDEGDLANSALARELDFSQKSHDRVLLTSVEAALTRIHEGTFGQCLNCEHEINSKRLEAIPWVRYCITCQELIDGTK
jgi:DnaK suppressor protein